MEVIKKVCRLSGGIYESVFYILVVELCSKIEELDRKKESEEVDFRLKLVMEFLFSV